SVPRFNTAFRGSVGLRRLPRTDILLVFVHLVQACLPLTLSRSHIDPPTDNISILGGRRPPATRRLRPPQRAARHRPYRTTATDRNKARATLRVARACCSGSGNELSG